MESENRSEAEFIETPVAKVTDQDRRRTGPYWSVR
jgi:hypothetical protein